MKLKQISQEDVLIFKTYFFRELEKSKIKDQGVYQKHDKSFKSILSNKEEMSGFLRHFLGFYIEAEKLEEQKNNFINEYFEKKESDVIYKIKDKEIYFLIEHQSSVDINMPERILKYSLELRRVAQKNQKGEKILLVVPIVIYTGDRKWKVATNFSSMQIKDKQYKKYLIKQKYELIDISKFTREDLIRENTKMTSMMLIEKCKTKEELIETLMELILIAEDGERIEWLEKVVEFILPDILGENKDEILEILKGRVKKDMDDEWIERIKRNEEKKERKLRTEGRKMTMIEIIKNMLMLNQDEKTIRKFTKARKSEIEEAKKELQVQVN